MSSRFIQGEGHPILTLYDSSDVLQTTINFPYVRDSKSVSYVKQQLISYPDLKMRQHKLLSGDEVEDAAEGYKNKITIYYKNIESTILKDAFSAILVAQTSDYYLKLQPRDDLAQIFKVIYTGDILFESDSAWQHKVTLEFITSDLITSLTLQIPA